MSIITEWVQTQPLLLRAVSTLTNTVDPRNWALTILLFLLDLCINISSIYFGWDTDKPAVACMVLGIVLMCLEVPFIGFYLEYARSFRSKIATAFKKNDSDEDGFLTRDEVENLINQLPKDTFASEFSETLEKYSLDNVLWCGFQPRMFMFRCLEFSVAWLMFFASLMLIVPGEPISTLVAIQGVVSIISIMLVLSDFFDNYFRKYKARSTPLKYGCSFLYGATFLAIFGVLLAGYGFVSLIYAGRANWPAIDVNTTAVPQDDLIGFVTGWLLTAFIVAAFLFLAIVHYLFALGGCLDVHIHHVGEDDPIKLLGKRPTSMFRSAMRFSNTNSNGTTTTTSSEPKLPPPPEAIKPPKEDLEDPASSFVRSRGPPPPPPPQEGVGSIILT